MSDIKTLSGFLLLHGIIPSKDITHWATLMVPAIDELIEKIRKVDESTADDDDYQVIFYDVGKKYAGEGKNELRVFFRILYAIIFRRFSGPRWGVWVRMVGKENFLWELENNYNNLLMLALIDKDITEFYYGDEE